MMVGLLFLALLAAPEVKAQEEQQERPKIQLRIVGGSNARPGQFPWQVWITGTKTIFIRVGCGGTLITDKHIITAAHCVVGVWNFQIAMGSVYQFPMPNEGTIISVSGDSATAHPNYNTVTSANDIAVITLPQRVTLSANIQPAKLPEPWEGSNAFEGRQVVVSGFGKTMDAEPSSHPILQYSALRILNHRQCELFYKLSFGINIGNGQICTTYIDRISTVCSGDSGGPLVINSSGGVPALIGVVSLGVAPCQYGGPAVYTAVANYLPWINGIIQGAGSY